MSHIMILGVLARIAWHSVDTPKSAMVLEIVGLVRDAKYSRVKRETPPVFFVPHRQMSNVGEMNFYVRTDGDLNTMLRSIPAVIRNLDPMRRWSASRRCRRKSGRTSSSTA